jgi:hypothetical protein
MTRPLDGRLHRLVEAVRGSPPTDEEARAIADAIEEHFVPPDQPPDWMLELLDHLLAGRTTPRPIPYPVGYPHGGNGLSNVLCDLEREVGSLGMDEQGEYLAWPLPSLGVRLVLIREGSAVYVVQPLDDLEQPPSVGGSEPSAAAAGTSHDPLHGLTLEVILTRLLEVHGWSGLARHIDVRCFKLDPSIKSSLTFLRRTPWARKRVEELYLAGLARR